MPRSFLKVCRTFIGTTAAIFAVGCVSIPTFSLKPDGGPSEAGQPDAAPPPELPPLRCTHCQMFVTHETFLGDIVGSRPIGDIDALCTKFGSDIDGKGGSTWKALLWAKGVSPLSRLRSPPDGWWSVTAKGKGEVQLFTGVEQMKSEIAPFSIMVTDRGATITDTFFVWTGGGAKPSEHTCKDWTSSDSRDQGAYGLATFPEQWRLAGNTPCATSGRLYCVEQ